MFNNIQEIEKKYNINLEQYDTKTHKSALRIFNEKWWNIDKTDPNVLYIIGKYYEIMDIMKKWKNIIYMQFN
jgi:hypothetical protein